MPSCVSGDAALTASRRGGAQPHWRQPRFPVGHALEPRPRGPGRRSLPQGRAGQGCGHPQVCGGGKCGGKDPASPGEETPVG